MSFYYKIDPNSYADISLNQWLTAEGAAGSAVFMHASGFYQSERKAAEHLRAPEFWSGLVTGQSTASLRIFSGTMTLQQLFAVLHLLPADAAYPLSLYRPHADLALAVRIDVPLTLNAEQIQALRQLSETWSAELVYLPAPVFLQQPGVLVMDMDSTAIQIECIDEIAKLAGVGEQVAAVTARAMNGELDFAQSLRQRVATLKDAPDTVLKQVLDAVPLMPGLEALVAFLQQHQWQVVIASGGFTYFTEALKQRLKLTATFANQLEIVDGKLTGQVLGAVVDAQTKADVVQQIARQYQIPASQTVAIGDGANDLPMLAVAALGVAFHAKPKVQAQAKAAIRQGSLLQLLYLLES
ncbi:MAG: phosphoserine phosphatase SerB [Gammaproteobacteria bacterium]|nr:phosphoserine phosphatase SerB [Gammaproteobacteria bacterium]MBU2059744.1 phosphoserine phosphatase SerB [Gammaproteobacteria bacterium]MBU2175476.1 phosphoserine phosphatase SerB [Gammaproteobacteria bacterium]MBU2245616.1 phosphoserine phosphatase SerB [Gammaproteobacteria bacterium]MBU2342789.1 phosphoserine phosphatase SerB [Gammaproteobacteria bacterium]